MNGDDLFLILTGRANKKQEGIYFLGLLSFLAVMLLLAQRAFPGGYTMLENYISDQGWMKENPEGFIFFTIGATVAGILLIPHFLYILRALMPTCKPLTVFSTFLGLVGSVGFALVGLISKDFSEPHGLAADLAFGGFAFSALVMLPVLLRKFQKKQEWTKLCQVIVLYAFGIMLVLLALFFQELDPNQFSWEIDPRWFGGPPWQWISFFNVLLWMASVFLILPDSRK